MNIELKAILSVVFDVMKCGKDLIEKKGISEMIGDLEKLGFAIPQVVSNWSSLQEEISALPGSAQEADLIAFVIASFAEIDSDAHAQKILNAALQMASHFSVDAIALVSAIQG